jgi:hypothetical protein
MTEALETACIALRLARYLLQVARTDFERAVAKTAVYHAMREVEAELPLQPRRRHA